MKKPKATPDQKFRMQKQFKSKTKKRPYKSREALKRSEKSRKAQKHQKAHRKINQEMLKPNPRSTTVAWRTQEKPREAWEKPKCGRGKAQRSSGNARRLIQSK